MATTNGTGEPKPEGVSSLLDTDLYKLTMQAAVIKYFKNVQVGYKFTNRTPHMQLTREAYDWLMEQIKKLGNIAVTDEEIAWLKKACPYFSEQYLNFLRSFRLKPKEQVKISFTPSDPTTGPSQPGKVSLSIHGLWEDTILYEIPLLALISEAYFKFVDCDWNHDGQKANASDKAKQLLEAGCAFSEFGSRRRRDYHTHDLVMQGLLEAQTEAADRNWPGAFGGTSNVHFAMKFNVKPIGTVAHEWFMGIAAITGDYARANEKAMQYWIGTFGRGTLSIALTDTFGTPDFLKAFARPAAKQIDHEAQPADNATEPSYAQVFTGTRQDSGDPLDFIQLMRTFYQTHDIRDAKTIVFSDSLNVAKSIKYREATLAAGLTPSFGVGTFFTNDFAHLSKPAEKSVPLNIVIKLSEAEGREAIKLSDNVGKNTGDAASVRRVKEQIGYVEKEWREGDEAHRWDK